MKIVSSRIIFCLLMCVPLFTWGDDKDINSGMVEILLSDLQSDDRETRIKSCRKIYEFGGFRDERLFDLIADRVQKNYRSRTASGGKKTDEYSWYVKALVASGNDKYIPLVRTVSVDAKNPKLRSLADTTLGWESYFKELNPVMQDVPFTSASNDPLRVKAYKALLNSDDPEIKKAVYRRIYDYSGIEDKDLYEIIFRDIKNDIQNGVSGGVALDQFAWKLKALSVSGMEEYLPIFDEASTVQLDTQTERAKLDKYIHSSRENVFEFAKWNAVQAHTENDLPGRDPRVADWMDYLQFGSVRMQTYAVRQAFGYDVYEKGLHEAIVAKMGDRYVNHTRDREELDFQSWVCRWLGEHRSAESKALLTDIIKKTSSKKVAGYARKALKLYK